MSHVISELSKAVAHVRHAGDVTKMIILKTEETDDTELYRVHVTVRI